MLVWDGRKGFVVHPLTLHRMASQSIHFLYLLILKNLVSGDNFLVHNYLRTL